MGAKGTDGSIIAVLLFIFLSFLIVPYRSDSRSRTAAATFKDGTEAGFGPDFSD
jgi:hypothetical protein